MSTSLNRLEMNVSRAIEQIASLRAEVDCLKRSLKEKTEGHEFTSLAKENMDLRSERALVRERIKSLIAEIDHAIL